MNTTAPTPADIEEIDSKIILVSADIADLERRLHAEADGLQRALETFRANLDDGLAAGTLPDTTRIARLTEAREAKRTELARLHAAAGFDPAAL